MHRLPSLVSSYTVGAAWKTRTHTFTFWLSSSLSPPLLWEHLHTLPFFSGVCFCVWVTLDSVYRWQESYTRCSPLVHFHLFSLVESMFSSWTSLLAEEWEEWTASGVSVCELVKMRKMPQKWTERLVISFCLPFVLSCDFSLSRLFVALSLSPSRSPCTQRVVGGLLSGSQCRGILLRETRLASCSPSPPPPPKSQVTNS